MPPRTPKRHIVISEAYLDMAKRGSGTQIDGENRPKCIKNNTRNVKLDVANFTNGSIRWSWGRLQQTYTPLRWG